MLKNKHVRRAIMAIPLFAMGFGVVKLIHDSKGSEKIQKE